MSHYTTTQTIKVQMRPKEYARYKCERGRFDKAVKAYRKKRTARRWRNAMQLAGRVDSAERRMKNATIADLLELCKGFTVEIPL